MTPPPTRTRTRARVDAPEVPSRPRGRERRRQLQCPACVVATNENDYDVVSDFARRFAFTSTRVLIRELLRHNHSRPRDAIRSTTPPPTIGYGRAGTCSHTREVPSRPRGRERRRQLQLRACVVATNEIDYDVVSDFARRFAFTSTRVLIRALLRHNHSRPRGAIRSTTPPPTRTLLTALWILMTAARITCHGARSRSPIGAALTDSTAPTLAPTPPRRRFSTKRRR